VSCPGFVFFLLFCFFPSPNLLIFIFISFIVSCFISFSCYSIRVISFPTFLTLFLSLLHSFISFGRSLKPTNNIYLIPRLRLSEVIPLIPLYAFRVWAGTVSPLFGFFNRFSIIKFIV
jgi:hypothetical protein